MYFYGSQPMFVLESDLAMPRAIGRKGAERQEVLINTKDTLAVDSEVSLLSERVKLTGRVNLWKDFWVQSLVSFLFEFKKIQEKEAMYL